MANVIRFEPGMPAEIQARIGFFRKKLSDSGLRSDSYPVILGELDRLGVDTREERYKPYPGIKDRPPVDPKDLHDPFQRDEQCRRDHSHPSQRGWTPSR